MDSSYRMELVSKLNKDATFKSLKTNLERIDFMLNKVLDYDSMLKLIKTNMESARKSSDKSLQLASSYKEEAEVLFLQMDSADDALRAVENAIIHVPVHETTLRCELYTLKSQIHYSKEEHNASLYSIQIAMDIETEPVNIDQYLIKLQCLFALRRYHSATMLIDDIMQQPDLFNQHTDISMLTKLKENLQNNDLGDDYSRDKDSNLEEYFTYKFDPRCKIEQSPVVGRHFVAIDDIPSGVVLLEERPYSIVMESSYMKKKCNSCLRELNYKLYPCAFCTELIFCDAKCFENAWTTFHRHECGLISILSNVTSPSFHVFRMISRVGPIQAYNTEAKKETYSIDQYLAEPRHRFVPEWNKTISERNRAYKMSSILWDHNEKHSDHSNAYHTVIALETAAVLDLVHNVRMRRPGNQFLLHFVDMIMVDIRRIIFNVFGWHEYNHDWSVRGHVANCQCLVGSLINHSCVPNTTWEWNDGIIRFTTKVAIPKGTEITITYGPSKDMTYVKRQERLNHYFFACKCAICLADAYRGNNLRCTRCDGPVVFNAAANQEKHLNGKCLLCYQPYEEFERTIKLITSINDEVKMISGLASMMRLEPFLDEATQSARKMIKLSLRDSIMVCKAILACSKTIQRFDLDKRLSIEERIELSLLFDQALPLELPVEMLNRDCIDSLQFWFTQLVHCIQQIEFTLTDQTKIDRKQLWDACSQFHQRIRSLMNALITQESIQALKEMVSSRLSFNDEMLNKCKLAYAQQASFVST